jgi:pimeloyl-ACP methyl ester carboxylesterase
MIDTWLAKLPHGITLSCRSAGARGRPVLLFLHGFPEAAFVWDELLAHFARPEHGGYRCVAPNLRGYERSSSPADPADYRPRLLVQDIAALIALECGENGGNGEDGAGGALAALVAHDWGGAVAWNLAAEQPTLLQRLVIINSPHPQTFARELQHSPAQQAASAYMNFLARPDAEALLAEGDFARLWPFFDLMGASGPPAGAAMVRDALGHGLAHPGALPDGAGWMTDALRAQYRAVWQGDGSRPGAGLTGGLNYYRISPLRPPPAGAAPASGVALPTEAFTVTVPTLVLWALQDSALLPALLDGLERWVPHLTLERVERATHWVVHEQPAAVAARIEHFLLSIK